MLNRLAKYTLVLMATCFSLKILAQHHDISQSLYATLKPKIVQIKIISHKTVEKSSIGSGFIVQKENIIATNYHVISQIANHPEDYYGEYLTIDNRTGRFELVVFDVINDLALLRVDESIAEPLNISSLPEKGAPIFSLGNPHDLGFAIVNGVNNGIIPNKTPSRVFFSASINSGMSGGPAVNADGQVVAVNVARRLGSGDISFLIPAKWLLQLIQIAKAKQFMPPSNLKSAYAEAINSQLLAASANYIERMKQFKRDSIQMGGLRFPSQIGEDFKCWSIDEKETEKSSLIEQTSVICRANRSYYISQEEQYGRIHLVITYSKAKESLSRRRFYRNITANDNSLRFSSKSTNDHPANCLSRFVDIAKHEFKLHICTQAENKRHGLATTRVLANSVDQDNESWSVRLLFQGSTTKEALMLTHSLLNDIHPIEKKSAIHHEQ